MTLKNLCYKYALDAAPEFWETPEEELAYIYNGAGPDWMPAWGRKILTEFLEVFQPSFVVHDWDYSRSDKTRKTFDIVNNRMWINMKKILDIEYPFSKVWLWPVRARWYLRARAAYRACCDLGWSAWIN